MTSKEWAFRLAVQAALRIPPRAGEAILGALGVVYGVVGRRHLSLARAWAAEQPGRRPWPLALSLLANGARSLANEAMLVQGSLDQVRRRFVLDGVARLEAAQRHGGTILLGFHLGPGVAALALRIFGHRITVAGLGHSPVGWPVRRVAWARFLDPDENPFVLWPEGQGRRVAGLYRLRGLLRRGQTVCIMAEGPGVEAFHIPLPGRDMVVRAGWFALRRLTGATTLPLLAHRDGQRVVVTVHPPLPAPDPDPAVDTAACRSALLPILADYVRRYPEQCHALAIFVDRGRERCDETPGSAPRRGRVGVGA
jgi:lauroyl/myristoyl acyltransferase